MIYISNQSLSCTLQSFTCMSLGATVIVPAMPLRAHTAGTMTKWKKDKLQVSFQILKGLLASLSDLCQKVTRGSFVQHHEATIHVCF